MLQEILPVSSCSSSSTADKKGATADEEPFVNSNNNNRGIDEMREEYEIKKSAPKKLRAACKNYRNGIIIGKKLEIEEDTTFDDRDSDLN